MPNCTKKINGIELEIETFVGGNPCRGKVTVKGIFISRVSVKIEMDPTKRKSSKEYLKLLGETATEIVESILDIKGVTELRIYADSISLKQEEVNGHADPGKFSWSHLMPRIEEVIVKAIKNNESSKGFKKMQKEYAKKNKNK